LLLAVPWSHCWPRAAHRRGCKRSGLVRVNAHHDG